MEIQPAKPENLDSWMALVEQVRDAFPGLETTEVLAEHRATVLQFIQSSSAICAVDAGHVVGTLLFSKENRMLCFLAVDPSRRSPHIARQMVAFMLTQMEEEKDITVTTYREGDPFEFGHLESDIPGSSGEVAAVMAAAVALALFITFIPSRLSEFIRLGL